MDFEERLKIIGEGLFSCSVVEVLRENSRVRGEIKNRILGEAINYFNGMINWLEQKFDEPSYFEGVHHFEEPFLVNPSFKELSLENYIKILGRYKQNLTSFKDKGKINPDIRKELSDYFKGLRNIKLSGSRIHSHRNEFGLSFA